jgi:pimeloyl-ACP methyl ester carboxylesterase
MPTPSCTELVAAFTDPRMVALDIPTDRQPACIVVLLGGSGPVNRDGTGPYSDPSDPSRPYADWASLLAAAGCLVARTDKKVTVALESAATVQQLTDEYLDDVLTMRATALERCDRHTPVVLLGHSLGGIAALLCTPDVPDVAAVAAIAPPVQSATAMLLAQMQPILPTDDYAALKQRLDDALHAPPAEAAMGATAGYWQDLARWDLASALNRRPPRLPVLIAHCEDDPLVPLDDVRAFHLPAHADPQVRLTTLPHADHMARSTVAPGERRYILEPLTSWLATEVIP